MLAFIWAEAANRVIGKNGNLPWNIPDDMAFFKETTLNHQIISGYTTFKSFGRPLPKRKNLVLTHRPASDFPNEVTIFNSTDDFLQYANNFSDELIFVVGGRAIYKELLPYTDYLYRTKIDKNIDGDTKMIDINYDDFEMIKEIPGAENAEFPHHFEIYQRRK